jgi:phosphate transport system substrate-binding protein
MPNKKGGKVRFRSFQLPVLLLALVPAVTSQNGENARLVGVGTSSTLRIYSKWFQLFEKTRPDLHFSYIPSGSQTGIEMVTSGTADFGATDAPMTYKDLAKAKVRQFASLLVALVPIYNLPGMPRSLKFSPQALAGIYLGTITKWNDPAISGPNPGVELPSTAIAVIHSADGRGGTYIWSDYLSRISIEWRTKVGRGMAIKWPVGKESDGNGNLSRLVGETPNSIGYVELAYAVQNQLPYGSVQNAAGNFIVADSDSITAAAASSVRGTLPDFRSSITNPPGAKSYPISSFTWILISQNMDSTTRQQAVKDFLRWMMIEGQTHVDAAGFASLPKAIAEQELDAIEKIP